ncbi:MAG TPA: transcriptional regulator, partial [Gammaproteobacteria bacterium]|nr:transcriptional regulator [Gammaproteobacteria bacterium]
MSQKKVLVVDDEPDIRTLVKEILEDEDYQVETAKDAASARLACQKQQPDLVLLDIWMPDEDGITLLQEWKKAGTYFPVIMMSGHGTVETAVEATRLGAIDFIEKPLSLARLLATVEKVLSADAQTVSANEGQPASSHGILSPEDAQLIGSSDYIKSIRKHIEQLASH